MRGVWFQKLSDKQTDKNRKQTSVGNLIGEHIKHALTAETEGVKRAKKAKGAKRNMVITNTCSGERKRLQTKKKESEITLQDRAKQDFSSMPSVPYRNRVGCLLLFYLLQRRCSEL